MSGAAKERAGFLRLRFASWASLFAILMAAARRLPGSTGGDPQAAVSAAVAIAAYLALLLAAPPLFRRASRRLPWFPWVYLLVLAGLVVRLGLLPPYEDTWILLFYPLGFIVVSAFPLRTAVLWGALFSLCVTLIMVSTAGWLEGLGFSLYYIAMGVFFVAYDQQFARLDAARRESRELLAGLQQAHERLQRYATQAEEIAAGEERLRIARELHDTVGQMIFSVSLHAEALRTLLEKDPRQVPAQLDRLQELTGSALGRMRQLISQWRPG